MGPSTFLVALSAVILQLAPETEHRALVAPELAKPCLELGDLVGSTEGQGAGDGYAELYCYMTSPSSDQLISSRESHLCELSVRFPNGEMRSTKHQLGRHIDGFGEVLLFGGRCFLWEDPFPLGTYEFELSCERRSTPARLSVEALTIRNRGAEVSADSAKRLSSICLPQ